MSVVSELISSDDCERKKPFNNETVEGLSQIFDEQESMYDSVRQSLNTRLNEQTYRLNQLYGKVLEPITQGLSNGLQTIQGMYGNITSDINGRLETVASQGRNYQTIPPETLPTIAGYLPEPSYPSDQLESVTDSDDSIPLVSPDVNTTMGFDNPSIVPDTEVSLSPTMAAQEGIDNINPLVSPVPTTTLTPTIEGIEAIDGSTTPSAPLPVLLVPSSEAKATTTQPSISVATSQTISQCCQQIAIAIQQIGATQQQQQAINQYIGRILEQQNPNRNKDTTELLVSEGTESESYRDTSPCYELGMEEQVKQPYCEIQKYKDLFEKEQFAANNGGIELTLCKSFFEAERMIGDKKLIPVELLEYLPKGG